VGAPAATSDAPVRGVGKALETVATLALMCDGRDFGVAMGDAQKGTEGQVAQRMYDPTLFLYAQCQAGRGWQSVCTSSDDTPRERTGVKPSAGCAWRERRVPGVRGGPRR